MLKILRVLYNKFNFKIYYINGFPNDGIIIGLWENIIKNNQNK